MSSENERLPHTSREGCDEGVVPKLDSDHIQKQDAPIGVKLIDATRQLYGRYSDLLLLLGYAFPFEFPS